MYTIVVNAGVVLRDSDGKQVAPCQSVEDPDFLAYIEWVNAGNAPAVTNLPEPSTRRLSKLAYMNRFTDVELANIFAAAKGSLSVEVWLAKFSATTPDADGTAIDLDDPRTVAGLQALEAAGLLASGRATQILEGM